MNFDWTMKFLTDSFANLEPQKSVVRQTSSRKETLMNGFLSSIIGKRSVGNFEMFRQTTQPQSDRLFCFARQIKRSDLSFYCESESHACPAYRAFLSLKTSKFHNRRLWTSKKKSTHFLCSKMVKYSIGKGRVQSCVIAKINYFLYSI